MTGVSNNPTGVNIASAFLNPPINLKMASDQDPSDVMMLTDRMSRGDEAAFHEFHALYYNRLLRYLFVITGAQEEITREALQLTFVRVARHVRKFDSETAFWNWLAMLARNCAVDEMRKRTKHQSLLARFFRQRPANADLKSSGTDERFSELLQEGLASLPAEERLLLERKYFNGESMRELAEEWQMTEKAMESHLLRVRRKLKVAILDRLKNEEND